MTLLREFYAPRGDVSPGLIGLQVRERLCTHYQNTKAIAEENAARTFLGIQQSSGNDKLRTVYKLPRTENPAGGQKR